MVLRPWCLLPSYPPRGSSYARRGSGPAVEAGARWVSESNLRGPQGLTSCGRLSASPSEARSRAGAWAVRVAPGRAQLPP